LKIFIESEVKVEKLPFTLEDASRTEEDVEKSKAEGVISATVLLDTRLDHRVIDLRVSSETLTSNGLDCC
jgi:hypothetical protein